MGHTWDITMIYSLQNSIIVKMKWYIGHPSSLVGPVACPIGPMIATPLLSRAIVIDLGVSCKQILLIKDACLLL